MTRPSLSSLLRQTIPLRVGSLRRQLGSARGQLRRLARRSYDRVRAIHPAYPNTLLNRGAALAAAGQLAEALAYYDRAIGLRPNNAAALYDHAVILRRLKRSDEALASLDRALALEPDFAAALISRSKILRLFGDIDESVKCHRKMMQLRPHDPTLHTALIFTLNFDPSATEAEKQRERAEWNRRHAQKFRSGWKPHDNDPDPERRLRIGYVSRYFRRDNAAYGFANAILHRDAERSEIFCYSDSESEDDVSARIRERAHHWRLTGELSDDRLADLIRQDRIDILIDCVGHMSGNRLLVFARKPAPVQVTAWGEPTGTGLEAMDYLFASPVLVPESDRGLFAEHVIDFPNFTGVWSPDQLPDVGPLPALSQGYVTFGSFNRVAKLSAPTIQCWAAILRRLPQARLILKNLSFGEPAIQQRIRDAFERHGVAASALIFLGSTDRQTHFACYNLVDIALDPFPHAGGMTTLDALWMGVPVITWSGRSVSARWAATSLVPLGLTDFVADGPESYLELAVAKAADLESLSRLRASLRTRVATSEFGDGPNYCRLVETACREIWRRWCSEQRSNGATTARSAESGP